MTDYLKIISTGSVSNGGICSSLEKFFPQTKFISRESGFDLSTIDGLEKFSSIIKDYNVFINHSQISFPNSQEKFIGAQEKLLSITREKWVRGHVITIGSILEFDEWEFLDPPVSKEKNKLKKLSLELNSENFKTTYLIVSGFDRYKILENDEVKIHPDDIVKTIKMILESELDFPLIYVEKTNDERLKKWRNIKNGLIT